MGKKKDRGPVSPLSNKLLSIRRPATKHRAAKTHHNTHTHTQSNYSSRGGTKATLLGDGRRRSRRKKNAATVHLSLLKGHTAVLFFQLFFTNKNRAGGEKNLDCFLIFLSCFHTRYRSLLHTYGLFLLFLIRQPNPTHVSRLAAPIPAFDNPSFSGSSLLPLARLPALTSGPTNS